MTSKEKKYGEMVADKIYFTKQLDELEINKSYTGYFMLVDIESLLVNNPNKIFSFSKEIYPVISKKYNKSECTVERNIRNLIDKCWSEKLNQKLKCNVVESEKPKCRDFIFKIRNYIISQLFDE